MSYENYEMLTPLEISCLVSDCYAELDGELPDNSADVMICWYLRNYLYLPYKQIEFVVNKTSASQSVGMNRWSFDGHLLSRLISLGKEYYGLTHNQDLQAQEEEVVDFLLYWSSDVVGVRDDKHSKIKYKPTPSSPPALELVLRIQEMDPLDAARDFEIKEID